MQVERDISRHRYVFEEQAKLAADAEDAAYQRETARSAKMGVYRVKVVGVQRALAQLINEQSKTFDEMP